VSTLTHDPRKSPPMFSKADLIECWFCAMYAAFVLLANLSTLLASATLVLQGDTTPETKTILEDSSLRTSCLIGAFLGATVSVCVRPGKQKTAAEHWRSVGLRGIASMASAVLITPSVFRWMKWQPDVDTVVACSGLIAFFSVALILELSPYVLNAITTKIKQLLGPIKEDSDK
jgi:cytochrome bd-type quinol oxidase subunit 2